MYYLHSRYYDPETCRFINADDSANLGSGNNILSHNLYAYCNNNPLLRYDPTGNWSWGGVLAGLAIAAVGVVAIVATVATGGAATPLAASLLYTTCLTAGCATTATGLSIVHAAANDSVVVLDLTVSAQRKRQGASLVMDFGNRTCELYAHVGYGTSDGPGISWSAGAVSGYDKLGDYAGDFIEQGASYNGSGLSYCQDPSMPFREGPRATSMSFSFGIKRFIAGVSYDYYSPVCSWEF